MRIFKIFFLLTTLFGIIYAVNEQEEADPIDILRNPFYNWTDPLKIAFIQVSIHKGWLKACRHLLDHVIHDFDQTWTQTLATVRTDLGAEQNLSSVLECLFLCQDSERIIEFIRLFREYGVNLENSVHSNKLVPIYRLLGRASSRESFSSLAQALEFDRFQELLPILFEKENYDATFAHLFLDSGIDFTAYRDAKGRNALMCAIDLSFTVGNLDDFIERLIPLMDDINAKDNLGRTALDRFPLKSNYMGSMIKRAGGEFGLLNHVHEYGSREDFIKAVQGGVDVNQWYFGGGPLIYVLLCLNDYEGVHLLLAAGADVNISYRPCRNPKYNCKFYKLSCANFLIALYERAKELTASSLDEDHLIYHSELLPLARAIVSKTDDLHFYKDNADLVPEFHEIVENDLMKRADISMVVK